MSYFLGEREEETVSVARRLVRALVIPGLVTAGFVVVFGAIGTLISLGSRSLVPYIPWISLGVGVVLIAVGAAILAGRSFVLGVHPIGRVGSRSTVR